MRTSMSLLVALQLAADPPLNHDVTNFNAVCSMRHSDSPDWPLEMLDKSPAFGVTSRMAIFSYPWLTACIPRGLCPQCAKHWGNYCRKQATS